MLWDDTGSHCQLAVYFDCAWQLKFHMLLHRSMRRLLRKGMVSCQSSHGISSRGCKHWQITTRKRSKGHYKVLTKTYRSCCEEKLYHFALSSLSLESSAHVSISGWLCQKSRNI